MIRLIPDSLRFRLLAGTSLAIVLVLVLLGLAIYFSVRHALISQLESELRGTASALAAITERSSHGLKFDADLQQMPEFFNSRRPEYFELRQADGRVVARSALLGNRDLPLTQASGHLTLPDGLDGWAVTAQFTVAGEHEDEDSDSRDSAGSTAALITVARGTIDVQAALARLRGLLLILCAAAVAASAAALLWVVRFGLRPVDRVADQIVLLNETELSSRLDETHLPAELRPIVQRLNGLLQRLAAAFERERSFTADVAHELRTPLSALLAIADVCRARPRSSAEHEAALDKSRELTRRLINMVQNLLTMARADAGQLTPSRAPVDLGQLLWECWSPLQQRAEARGVNLQSNHQAVCPIQSDADKLRLILSNLLDNAVSYVNEGGSISLAISQGLQDSVCLEVANTGNRIAAENMAQVFERFWRSDAARSQTGVHCGLGLSLCQRLANVMGIQLQVEARPPDWFVVRLTFPLKITVSQHTPLAP